MNKKRKLIIACVFIMMLLVIISGTMSMADSWEIVDDSSWCSEKSSFFSETVCEVRELTVNDKWRKITVDAKPNGGIKVEGWDKNTIQIKARVQANAKSEKEASEILSEIDIEISGNKIHADGPKFFGSKKSWSVSYSLMVPEKSNLKLSAMNGGINIHDVNGNINAKTMNGGIGLARISGDVEVNTINGGITAELDGNKWKGRGFEARTTNGGIKLKVPDNYSADLEASTVNGGIHIDFPIKVQGWIKRNIDTTLGDGGAPIILRTINGGVSVDRK